MAPKPIYRSHTPSVFTACFRTPKKSETPPHETLSQVRNLIQQDKFFGSHFLAFVKYVQGSYTPENREKLKIYAETQLFLSETNFTNLVGWAQHRNFFHWFHTTSISDFLSDAGYGFFDRCRFLGSTERKNFEQKLLKEDRLTHLPNDVYKYLNGFLGTVDQLNLKQTNSARYKDRAGKTTLHIQGDVEAAVRQHLGRYRTSDPALTTLVILYPEDKNLFIDWELIQRIFPNLKALQITKKPGVNHLASPVLPILKHLPQLESLQIMGIARPSEEECIQLARLQHGLKQLYVTSTDGISDSVATNIILYHLRLNQLEVLKTPHTTFVPRTLTALSLYPRLKEIEFDEERAEAEPALVNLIQQQAHQLRALRIPNTDVTLAILNALIQCPLLAEIEFFSCPGEIEDVLARLIQTHSHQLQVFSIPYFAATEPILEALSTCRKLIKIKVSGIWDNDVALALITQMPELRFFEMPPDALFRLMINAEGLTILRTSPVKHLSTIEFDSSCTEEAIAAYLREAQLESFIFYHAPSKARISYKNKSLVLSYNRGDNKHEHLHRFLQLLLEALPKDFLLSFDFTDIDQDFVRGNLTPILAAVATTHKEALRSLTVPRGLNLEQATQYILMFTNLRTLNLHCRVSNTALQSFHGLKNLTKLDLGRNNYPYECGREALKNLQKTLPRLRVYGSNVPENGRL